MSTLKTKITTPHFSATTAFYKAVFGLVVVEEWNEAGDQGVILGFDDGPNEALLEIYSGPAVRDFSGLSLQLRVEDIEKFVTELPVDVVFEGPTPRPWGSIYVYLEDPNQIQVIFYQGGW